MANNKQTIFDRSYYEISSHFTNEKSENFNINSSAAAATSHHHENDTFESLGALR